jgi:hypothetical protein
MFVLTTCCCACKPDQALRAKSEIGRILDQLPMRTPAGSQQVACNQSEKASDEEEDARNQVQAQRGRGYLEQADSTMPAEFCAIESQVCASRHFPCACSSPGSACSFIVDHRKLCPLKHLCYSCIMLSSGDCSGRAII